MMVPILGTSRLHSCWMPPLCLCPEIIFGVTVLASISSLSCRLQFAIRGVISLTSIFLKVLGIIDLSEIAGYLFRSHLLDVVGDAAENVSVFSLRKNTHM